MGRLSDEPVKRRIADNGLNSLNFFHSVIGCVITADLLSLPVIDTLKTFSGSYRPIHMAGPDAKYGLDLVEKFVSISCFAVHFINERKYGNMPHYTDLEQLDRLSLDTL